MSFFPLVFLDVFPCFQSFFLLLRMKAVRINLIKALSIECTNWNSAQCTLPTGAQSCSLFSTWFRYQPYKPQISSLPPIWSFLWSQANLLPMPWLLRNALLKLNLISWIPLLRPFSALSWCSILQYRRTPPLLMMEANGINSSIAKCATEHAEVHNLLDVNSHI